jgi:hypothetical protein
MIWVLYPFPAQESHWHFDRRRPGLLAVIADDDFPLRDDDPREYDLPCLCCAKGSGGVAPSYMSLHLGRSRIRCLALAACSTV